jgi:hypothetical protein
MKVDHIRRFLKRKPFLPFHLQTAAGDVHKVSHLESISVSPRGDAVVLWPSEGGLVVVDVDQITEAAYPSGRARGRGTSVGQD